MNEKRARMAPRCFDIPVEKIRSGFYSDTYFNRTREILIEEGRHPHVVMQVFCRRSGIACGVDEAIAVLRTCAERPQDLVINALRDGDAMDLEDTVVLIEGDYSTFAHLETIYLGALARSSAVATAVRRVVEAARGRTVLFFAARFDHWSVQDRDGYAALIGGAHGVSTDANGSWLDVRGVGTIPHALIAAFEGDTAGASLAFDRCISPDVPRVVLADFQNDCVKTSLEAARALGKKLWGVRLDTAGDMCDVSIKQEGARFLGVCPELVWNVRKALDEEGYTWVKIVVSGGFTADKVRRFVEQKVPFDAVGIGSSLYRERIDFTADIVMVNGRPCAKVGRRLKPNPKLEIV